MDDPRTRESLDALADLFLTGVADPEAEPAEAPHRAEHGERPDEAAADSPLDGPEPLRLRPKLGRARSPQRDTDAAPAHTDHGPWASAPRADRAAAPDADEAEGEAEAPESFPRLHRAAAASPLAAIAGPDAHAAAPPSADLVVEGVLLGNLPGISGPWLTQYAQLLAQHDGPVAVLHLDAGEADLELVEPADAPDRDPPRAFRRSHTPHSAQTLGRVLRELMRDLDSPVRTLLVHAPAEPASAVRLAGLELWTLLCGADDAAVVAGYRLLKSLIGADPASAAKQVGLMVMGSDEPTSRRAADKLASASASFLHVPVQLVGWQQRMLPVNVRQLGRFDLDAAAVARLLAELTDAPAGDEGDPRDEPPRFEPQRPAPAERPRRAAAAASATPPADSLDDEPIGLAPEPPEPADAPEPARPGHAGFAADAGTVADDPDEPPYYDLREPAEPAAERPARPEPRPRAAEPERKPQPEPAADHRAAAQPDPGPQPAPDAASNARSDAAPDLAALLAEADPDLAGAVALQARCPLHQRVQLALDQHGRVHLLTHHDGDDADGLHAALVELLQVRAWATEHRDLLALTQRQLRFDPQLTPALHLFTGAARLAAGLSARLPADLLRLHLLQAVELDGDTAWLATPLS